MQKPSILLVDDEPSIRTILTFHLQADYEVVTAADGEEALDVLRSRPIDLILSDHAMPRMTGVELLRHARTLRPMAIRVLISGSADPNLLVSAINDAGIHKFIPKPWSDEELARAVHELIIARSRELYLGA